MKRIKIPPITVIFLLAFFCIDFSYYTLIILLSALIHECGHLVFILIFGVGVEEVVLLPVGVCIKEKPSAVSYQKEIIIALGGCLINLLLFLIFFSFCPVLAITNLFFFSLNILPIYSFDGGRILRLFLTYISGIEKAVKICRGVSFVFSLLLWVLGVYIMLCLQGNLSVFALSLFLITDEVIKKK